MGIWLRNRFFNAENLDFSAFPNTLLVYGEKDHLIEKSHCFEYEMLIRKVKKVILPDAGHAPHLHDPAFVSREISKAWEAAK